MIKTLKLQNFILFEDEKIEFIKQTNVLVGDSGAGKSLIFKALKVLSGERNDKTLIMNGKSGYHIEAEFDLTNINQEYKKQIENILQGEVGKDLIIFRSLNSKGVAQIRINGMLITLNDLRNITKYIIDIHEQNTTDTILKNENQIKIIDSLITKSTIEDYKIIFFQYKKIEEELKNLTQKLNGLEDELEIIDFKIGKIKQIENFEDEDILESKIEQMKIKQKEQVKIQKIKMLVGKINNNIKELNSEAEDITFLKAEEKQMIEIIYDNIEDLSFSLEKEEIDYDEETFENLVEQLTQIRKLKRKYNLDYVGLKQKLRELEEEKAELLQLEDTIINKSRQRDKLEIKLKENAEVLTNKRKEIGQRIVQKINKGLSELGMENAELKIEFIDSEFQENGKDHINFLLKANKGHEFLALDKIASGGEKNRIMLVIKAVLNQVKVIGTILLDEIDQGVSSELALKIGNLIQQMGKNYQIILISHTPQVISKNENLILVEKNNHSNFSFSTTCKLNTLEKEKFINNMLKI